MMPKRSKRQLRADLIAKTNWTKQGLSRRVRRVMQQTPTSTQAAQWVVARLAGIKLESYLDDAELGQVREVLSRLSVRPNPPSENGASQAPTSALAPVRPTGHRDVRLPREFSLSDPLLSAAKLGEAREMAHVYPLLYVIENSMREVIKRVLGTKYGADWWNTGLSGGRVKQMKDTVDSRRAKEDQRHWHQRRGAHPIDYIDLDDLEVIVSAKQADFFPDILGEREWFLQFMRELKPSRHVVCHMNPLDAHNIRHVRLKAEQWRRQVAGGLAKIPAAPAVTSNL